MIHRRGTQKKSASTLAALHARDTLREAMRNARRQAKSTATPTKRKTRRGGGSSARSQAQRAADRRERASLHEGDAMGTIVAGVKSHLDHDPKPSDLSTNARAVVGVRGEDVVRDVRRMLNAKTTP